MTSEVKARAHANVALVKYFGKRDVPLNLPAAPSVSMTLSPLNTETVLSFADGVDDQVLLADVPAEEKFSRRISKYLNIFRDLSGNHRGVRVTTSNNFPTAAGLASSASGFAALAAGAARLFDVNMDIAQLSAMARRGSGSAARSVCGGYVLWHRGEKNDGTDSFAESVAPPEHWDLRILVGVTTTGPKEIGSTVAMERTRTESPYYNAWIKSAHGAAKEAVDAILKKDFEKLGDITEHSALAMHAAMMAAAPPIVFLKGTTLDVFHLARSLRKEGTAAYFTCDAGPQPKLLCQAKDADIIARQLRAFPGIKDVIHCAPAEGVRVETNTTTYCEK
ncbi:MAG: diphosphomevalonate decarboxylase [Deltaproteobacteria bacterium]|nr:diphosphomevalonate decarboxylase [Deltaproteobacteria bacterium]